MIIDKVLAKDLSERIERRKKSIEDCLKDWGKVPLGGVPQRIYFGLADDARDIAVFSLLLDNNVEALKWFRHASDYFYKEVETQRAHGACSYESESARCGDAFSMAIFSGDRELIDKCIDLSLGICKEYPDKFPDFSPFYFYLMALVYLMQGSFDKAVYFVDKMPTDVYEKLVDFQSYRKESLRGLITGDRSMMVSGLNELLSYHDKHVESRMAYDLISIDATVLIKVAREKGIVVKPEDVRNDLRKYIPWNLFE